jgi:hypothetical protein
MLWNHLVTGGQPNDSPNVVERAEVSLRRLDASAPFFTRVKKATRTVIPRQSATTLADHDDDDDLSSDQWRRLKGNSNK